MVLRWFASALAGCLLCAFLAAAASAQLRAELTASGLSQPVAFVQDPSDPTVQVVVEQNGRVRALKNGVVQAADYLDLRGIVLNSGEQGLLGLAFAPNYATSGRVFLNFINLQGHTVVSRFKRSATDPLRADPSSRFDLQWPDGLRFIQQPFANHNGGHMAFGPDGFLYIGMGDGGSGNDPFHLAQNPQSLLGKVLRLSVSVADSDPEGYDVPASNPFVGQAGVLSEIWSFGWRNPWRWSFDTPARGGTGAMIAGDVGQGAFEEINYEPAGRGGRNYGWRNREGAHNNITNLPPFSTPLIDPIFEYPRSDGQSVTGGFVYRGSALGQSFRGRYFFADFVASRVWSVRLTINSATGEATASDRVDHTAELGSAASNPSSFGEDASGELYLVSYGGSVHRIASTNPPVDPPVNPPGTGGRRRPAGVPAVGFAVPRNNGTGVASEKAQTVRSSEFEVQRSKLELRSSACAFPEPAIALLRVLSGKDADAIVALAIALVGADVVGEDGLACLFRRDTPGADHFAFSHFTLRSGDGLQRFRDAGHAPTHQLRRSKTRHDRELELIHLDGTIDHDPPQGFRAVDAIVGPIGARPAGHFWNAGGLSFGLAAFSISS